MTLGNDLDRIRASLAMADVALSRVLAECDTCGEPGDPQWEGIATGAESALRDVVTCMELIDGWGE